LRTVLKRIHIGLYGFCAIALIAIAALVRLVLLAQGWPGTNSDEGTMGLEAMHIAFRGEHPIFLYGQNYMGMVEAYVGAALFRLFGVSLFNLRLGMLLLFTLFLIAMYALTSLLYSKKLALVVLALLCVGTPTIIITELLAVGGVVETMLFGTLLMLLASWLALTFVNDTVPRTQRWRYVVYGCWGFVGGIGLYSHMLVLPFLAMSGLILLVFCHYELRRWALLWLIVGFLIGATPLIIYNVTAPVDQNSLAVLLQLHRADANAPGAPTGLLLLEKELLGTFLDTLPIATNFYPACALQNLPLFGPTTADTATCTIIQGSWSLGYMALLVIALFLAIRPLWRQVRQWYQQQSTATSTPLSIEERKHTVLEFARLMLLLSAAITLFLYVSSPTAAVRPWSTRYLIGLLIALPAVLWPLWHGMRTVITPLTSEFARFMLALRSSIIVLIGAVFLIGTIATFMLVPGVQASNQQDTTVIHDLSQADITHMYSDYWTCDRLVFLSQEHLICGVVDEGMTEPGLNRYSPYYTEVQADPHSAYIFVAGSDYAYSFEHWQATTHTSYHKLTFDGYVVYVPIR
jgi:4-amino-4-deoxy-L-arabinose transferase-like glycosyltransferase